MGEAVGGSAVAIDCESFASADSSSQEYHSFSGSTRSFGDSFRVLRSFNGGSFRVHSVADSPPSPSAASSADHHVIALAPPPKPPLPDAGQEVNPQDAWLPITESRDGGGFSAVFHLVCSGIGLQSLLLPVAFATLGWAWGITCLSVAFVWQFYTIWLLVNLHESNSSQARYSRYVHLSIIAFGEKLGKLLAIFPVMYLSGGTCAMLIITGGGTMQLFYRNLCSDGGPTVACNGGEPSGAVWFFLFACMAILVAQLPNLNSVSRVSLVGSITAVAYCTLLWALPIGKDRPAHVSHRPLVGAAETGVEKFGGVLNAVGIIVLSFRGHNLILEIQATLPSSPKEPSTKTMWRGVKISYLQIALCLFPIAIGGFWAYGNQIPANGGMSRALSQFHGQEISKFVMGSIYLLIVINCISTFQVYSMVVFDNLESRYTGAKNRPCPRWLRTMIRLFFGGFVYFISVAFPFLGSLAPLIGGLTMPLTYAYPCFMWISIKKPQTRGPMWLINVALGCLGVILSVVLVVAALWNLADKGLKANFFRP